MKIGFIGLGIMGKPMAKNLLKSGHELTVFDVNKSSMDELTAAGAAVAASAADVARNNPVILTMLPNSPHVKTVVMGTHGVLEGAASGSTLIDMSSIAPAASKEIGAACAAKGVRMLDSPVSGGEPKAIDGTLSIMVGGERALFEQMQELLLCMGSSAVYCGSIGAGNTTKLANQVIVAGNIAAVAEAFTLAKKSGVDPQLVYDAIRGGLAGSTVMDAKAPMMMAGNFQPGFRIELHIKDLMNALDSGHDVGAPLPLTAMIMEMLQTLRADNCGQDDHSALAKYYAKVSGVTISD